MSSFAFKAKNEMCRVQLSRQCCARAEAYGVLLYCNTFTPSEVRIITENPEFAARLPKLFHKAFSLRFDQTPEGDGPGQAHLPHHGSGEAGEGHQHAGVRSPADHGAARKLRAVGGGLLPDGVPAGGIFGGRQRHRPQRSGTIWSWPPVMCRPAGRYRR